MQTNREIADAHADDLVAMIKAHCTEIAQKDDGITVDESMLWLVVDDVIQKAMTRGGIHPDQWRNK